MTTLGRNIAECTAMMLSAFGSVWLLWVCSPRSRHLSSRLLWHLGIADVAFIAIQLAGKALEVCDHVPSREEAMFERGILHFFSFAVCLIEALLAAGVTISGFRDMHAARWLAKLLPSVWLVSALCEFVDVLSLQQTTEITSGGTVTGSCIMLGIMMGVCFVVSTVLYIVAIALLRKTCSPTVVVARKSRQAFIFLLSYFITMLPTWLLYINAPGTHNADSDDHVWYQVADTLSSVLFVSNGWLNAVTRVFQDRRLHFRRDGDIGIVDGPSLCVGFGNVSTHTAPPLHSTVSVSSSSLQENIRNEGLSGAS